MVEFKTYADKIIKERYGIEVEHVHAICRGEKLTYERQFYKRYGTGKRKGQIYGFPHMSGAWCNSSLKTKILSPKGAKKNIVWYIGIAADEVKRIEQHSVSGKVLPLVDIGWDENYCRQWCEENNLLSPIYASSTRGGCWFCHNQRIDQLRLLRKDYPELWKLLLKWDLDSPYPFRLDGRTVHDFEKRFQAEDDGRIEVGTKFRWKSVI